MTRFEDGYMVFISLAREDTMTRFEDQDGYDNDDDVPR